MADNAVEVVFGADTAQLQAGAKQAKASLDDLFASIGRAASQAAGTASANDNLAKSVGRAGAGFKEMAKGIGDAAYELGPWTGTHVQVAQSALIGLQGALGTAGIAFAAIGAAAAVAMGAVGAAAIHMGETAQRMASQFELSGEGVTRLGAVASKSGLELKDLATALQDISKKARDGDKDIEAAAKALGLTSDQLKSKDLPGLLRTLQAAYDKNGDSANRYAAMTKLLGDNFEQLYPVMQQGVGALDGLYAAADRSGSAISGALKDALAGSISASREAGAAWTEFKQSIEGAVLAMYEHFKPAIDGAIMGFGNLVRNIASAVQGFTSAAREASVTSLALDAIATAAKGVVLALALATAAFETLLTTASAVLKQIGDLARGVVGIFNELWKAIKGEGSDVGGAWSKMTGDMKRDAVDLAGNLRTIAKQVKDEFATTMGAGVQGKAPAANLRATGNPEPDKDDKAKKAKAPKGNDDELNAARTEIDGEIAEAQRGLKEKEKIWDEEVKLKLMSESEKLAKMRAAVDEEYGVEKSLLQKELALEDQKPQKRQEVLNKLKALEQKHADEVFKINSKAAEDTVAPWHKMIDSISSSLQSSIMGMIEHTTKLSDAIRNMARTIVSQFVSMGLQSVAEFAKGIATQVALALAGEQAQTAAKSAGVAERSGLAAGGAIADAAANIAAMMKSVAASAGAAGAGVAAFLAPVQGPAAIPEGQAAAAAVAAMGAAAVMSADIGAWNIPHDQLAFVHKGEMIATPAQAEGLRSLVENGGARGGGNTTTVHAPVSLSVTAMDSRSVQRMFNSNDRAMLKAIGRAAQRGAHLGVKGL